MMHKDNQPVQLLCQVKIENEKLTIKNESSKLLHLSKNPSLSETEFELDKTKYIVEIQKLIFTSYSSNFAHVQGDINNLDSIDTNIDIVSNILFQKITNICLYKKKFDKFEASSVEDFEIYLSFIAEIALKISIENKEDPNLSKSSNSIDIAKEGVDYEEYLVNLLHSYNKRKSIFCNFTVKHLDGMDIYVPRSSNFMLYPIHLSNIIVNRSFEDMEDSDDDSQTEQVNTHQQDKDILKSVTSPRYDIHQRTDFLSPTAIDSSKQDPIDEFEEDSSDDPEDSGLGVVAAFRHAERKGIWTTDTENEEDWI